jgi:CRISPR-associated protein Cas2
MDILITYDIETIDRRGEKRLREVAKVCEGYGIRVQYSVFECRISRTGLERLVTDLSEIIHPARDSVRIYRFHGPLSTSRLVLGVPVFRELGQPWII